MDALGTLVVDSSRMIARLAYFAKLLRACILPDLCLHSCRQATSGFAGSKKVKATTFAVFVACISNVDKDSPLSLDALRCIKLVGFNGTSRWRPRSLPILCRHVTSLTLTAWRHIMSYHRCQQSIVTSSLARPAGCCTDIIRFFYGRVRQWQACIESLHSTWIPYFIIFWLLHSIVLWINFIAPIMCNEHVALVMKAQGTLNESRKKDKS